ncbi:MAG: oxidoreductase-like domain-containing protein [Burkholderiaceae bacterium]
MQPPREPLPGQCCGNGCVTCVWHVYDRELLRYREWLAEQPIQPMLWDEPEQNPKE